MTRSAPAKLCLAVVALLLLVPASAQARRSHHARCSLKHSRTLQATRDVRIFRTVTGEIDTSVVYGCAYRKNRRVRLGHFSGFDTPTALNIAVAGRYAGYSLETDNAGTGTAQVAVTDLVRRRRVRTVDVPNTNVFQSVTDVVLARTGSVAWIEYSAGTNATPVTRIAVRRADGAGVTTLEQSPSVVRGSLARAGDGTLFWRSGALARFGQLQ